jgi:hypothetical protein
MVMLTCSCCLACGTQPAPTDGGRDAGRRDPDAGSDAGRILGMDGGQRERDAGSDAGPAPDGGAEIRYAAVWSDGLELAGNGVAWHDFDGDGDDDLTLTASNFESVLRLVTNEPTGTLSVSWDASSADHARDPVWVDWDGDDATELLVQNDGVGLGAFAITSGAPSLERMIHAITHGAIRQSWLDFDVDGDLDVALARIDPFSMAGGARSVVLRNDDGSFVEHASTEEIARTYSFAWGDLDGDTDPDLAAAGLGADHVYELRDGALAVVWTSTTLDTTYDAAWFDWDGDGDLDLAACGDDGVMIAENDEGTLTEVWTDAALGARALAWTDADLDGDGDLAVAARSIAVYRNDEGAMVRAWSSPASHDAAWTDLAWGFLDGDPYPDLAGSAFIGAARVYRHLP